jgi:3-isopropylmalate/(R)-2-methylmalate dehydratase small subunit
MYEKARCVMSNSFPVLTGVVATLLRDNIDAMTIAPRTAAEKGGAATQGGAETIRPHDLFAHLRYLEDGAENPDFVLNKPDFREVTFLVTGRNFGCGSAREHAVWALCAVGIRCVVAAGFGPLFYGNCFKNGVVPVDLDESEVRRIAGECLDGVPKMTLDLHRRELLSPRGRRIAFTLPEFRYRQLIQGLDEIDMTLQQSDAISAYQKRAAAARPWMF